MTRVIIHCSDSCWGNAAAITTWHLQRGFTTIAYHYVILNGLLSPFKRHPYFDGTIETGRPLDDDKDFELDEKGAHAFGYNMAVGICLIGLSGVFTPSQKRSLRHLLKMLKAQFEELEILQHSDVSKAKPHCAGLTEWEMKVLRDTI